MNGSGVNVFLTSILFQRAVDNLFLQNAIRQGFRNEVQFFNRLQIECNIIVWTWRNKTTIPYI